jgi:hypothetical protein
VSILEGFVVLGFADLRSPLTKRRYSGPKWRARPGQGCTGFGGAGAVGEGLLGGAAGGADGGLSGADTGDSGAGDGVGEGADEEEEADPSPPFAKGATGFGMTTVGGGIRLEGVCCGAVIGGAADWGA